MDACPADTGIKTAAQTNGQLSISALPDIPLVNPGDDLTNIICFGLSRGGITLQDGDILVLAQKIVSKSEGRYAALESVIPSPAAIELAEEVNKDPRLVELILSESSDVVRKRKGVLSLTHPLVRFLFY